MWPVPTFDIKMSQTFCLEYSSLSVSIWCGCVGGFLVGVYPCSLKSLLKGLPFWWMGKRPPSRISPCLVTLLDSTQDTTTHINVSTNSLTGTALLAVMWQVSSWPPLLVPLGSCCLLALISCSIMCSIVSGASDTGVICRHHLK